jgi:mutator protein MutT
MFKIGVFAIIFDEQKRVLLCHRRDFDLWNLPGGGLEKGETPWDGVAREVKEEVGLDVEVERLAGIYSKPDKDEVVFSFICRVLGGKISTSEEADEIAFFNFSDLPSNTVPKQVERIHDILVCDTNVILKTQRGPSATAAIKSREDLKSLTIRPARSDEYLKFHEICDNDLPHPLSLEERLNQRRREFEQILQGKTVTYFAEVDGQVIGSVQLRLGNKAPSEGKVHALVVKSGRRRVGIGSRLMDAVEEDAIWRGFQRVWLTVHANNRAAIGLYLKRGYTEITSLSSGDENVMVEMAKQIKKQTR